MYTSFSPYTVDVKTDNSEGTEAAAHEPMDEEETENSPVTEPEVLKPPKCLSWYPDNLAWQLEYSRVSIRQNQTLKKLHSFLVSESESVSILESVNILERVGYRKCKYIRESMYQGVRVGNSK